MAAVTRDRLEAVLADYDAALSANNDLLADNTARAYRSRVAGFLDWLADADLDGDPLADPHARNHAVRDYRAFLKTTRGRKPTTLNAVLTALDHFYDHLGLGHAVARREDLPAAAPRALDEDDQRRFLRAVEKLDSVRDQAICSSLFYTGIRVAELVALNLADVQITARKGRIIVRAGKGDRYREVPLHAQSRPILTDWRHQRASWPGADQTPALFLNRYGGRLSTRSVDDLVARLGRDARLVDHDGGDGLTPHVLRHTFGTRLLRSGVDVVLVAELMGHARLDTTRRYTLPTDADREAAIEKLLVDR